MYLLPCYGRCWGIKHPNSPLFSWNNVISSGINVSFITVESWNCGEFILLSWKSYYENNCSVSVQLISYNVVGKLILTVSWDHQEGLCNYPGQDFSLGFSEAHGLPKTLVTLQCQVSHGQNPCMWLYSAFCGYHCKSNVLSSLLIIILFLGKSE